MGISLITDPQASEAAGKFVTLVVTAASMSLAFALIHLFPFPLPIIVAALVAYATYRNPPVGAFTGSMIIFLGLFYHLSRIGFFELFPSPWMRLLAMVILVVTFFILSPMRARAHRILANNHEVRLEELGVSEKFGREYLKLYLRSHSRETPLEEVGDTLRRIT